MSNAQEAAPQQPKEKPSTIFKLGGKKVDATKGLPLTLGQFRRMKKEFGTGMKDIGPNMEAEHLYAVASVVLTAADPTLTEEDINKLTFRSLLRLGSLVGDSMAQEEVDRPT